MESPAGIARDWPRSDILRALRPLFERFPADILLRGSAARQDRPYDDLDIAVVTTQDRSLLTTMPTRLDGLAVHYSHLPRQLLHEFFETYPRCWDLAVDGIPLRRHDPGVHREIAHQRVVIYDRHPADTILFLLHEDEIETRRRGDPADYHTRKGLPGSRHTATRAVFLLRALYPELRRLPTSAELLTAAENRGVAPAGISRHVQAIHSAIRRAEVSTEELLMLFEPISAWLGDLRRQTRPMVEKEFEPAYLRALSQASGPLSGSAGQLLADYALGPLRTSRRYVLLTTLATNPDLTADTIMMLWNRFSHNTVHRGLLRRLARHPRFPPGTEANSALTPEDLTLTKRLRTTADS